jgi:RHS repeat-associated protein
VKQDLNRNIQNVSYNYQQLPEEVTYTTGHVIKKVKYDYNNSGKRIRKTITLPDNSTETFRYVRDASGALIGELDERTEKLKYTMINSDAGIIGMQEYASDGTESDFYYLKDHLGNTRVVIKDERQSTTVTEDLSVVSAKTYYPFGLEIKRSGQIHQGSNDLNKFSFQGKERDQETGYDYFEARFYDPAIARFMQVDPLAEKFVHNSSFVSMNNNPISTVDPTGMAYEMSYGIGDEEREKFKKKIKEEECPEMP